MELAIGASIAGRRALVCIKSVGMNAMLDPLMVLNLTPVHGGLVILLGDDPGGYGSQNDQDTRPLATAAASAPGSSRRRPGRGFRHDARGLRGLRATSTARHRPRDPELHPADRADRSPRGAVPPAGPGAGRERWRFVPVPSNVVEKQRALHARQADACRWVEGLPFNQIRGNGDPEASRPRGSPTASCSTSWEPGPPRASGC